MPSPSTSLATQRPDLAASFMEFDLEMQRRGYIASQVLPVLEVAKQAGIFGKIPIEQLLQKRDTARAPGAGYSRGKFTFTATSFACQEQGAEEPIDDRERQMYSAFFDAEQVSTARAFEAVLRNAEQRASDAIFNSTTWTGAPLTTDVPVEWSTIASANPITDVEAAVKKVWDASGLWPNALVINRRVFRNVRRCAQVVDLMKQQNFVDVRPGAINAAILAQVFDLDRVIIAGSATNSAIEGQSAVIAPIWSDEYAMVCRIATSNDIREPAIGRTFHWNDDGSVAEGRVESYRDESVRSDIVRVRHDVAEQVLYVQAGHLLSNITA